MTLRDLNMLVFINLEPTVYFPPSLLPFAEVKCILLWCMLGKIGGASHICIMTVLDEMQTSELEQYSGCDGWRTSPRGSKSTREQWTRKATGYITRRALCNNNIWRRLMQVFWDYQLWRHRKKKKHLSEYKTSVISRLKWYCCLL